MIIHVELQHYLLSVLSIPVMVHANMRCIIPVEAQYWALQEHQPDLCAHCAGSGAAKPVDSLKKFKKVSPICEDCLKNGLIPIQSMPYK